MNRKLAEKIGQIVACFAKANVRLPVTNVRSNIKKVTFEGHEGIKIENIGNSNIVWGVTPREYWKYCKSVNQPVQFAIEFDNGGGITLETRG